MHQRPIHLASLDKVRPVVILTREEVRDIREQVTVVPITSTRWGVVSEVSVGPENGLDHPSFANCDTTITIDRKQIGRLLGYLSPEQEARLAAAIVAAYQLELS